MIKNSDTFIPPAQSFFIIVFFLDNLDGLRSTLGNSLLMTLGERWGSGSVVTDIAGDLSISRSLHGMMKELKSEGSILHRRLGSSSRNCLVKELLCEIRSGALRFKDLSKMMTDLGSSVVSVVDSLDKKQKAGRPTQ